MSHHSSYLRVHIPTIIHRRMSYQLKISLGRYLYGSRRSIHNKMGTRLPERHDQGVQFHPLVSMTGYELLSLILRPVSVQANAFISPCLPVCEDSWRGPSFQCSDVFSNLLASGSRYFDVQGGGPGEPRYRVYYWTAPRQLREGRDVDGMVEIVCKGHKMAKTTSTAM